MNKATAGGRCIEQRGGCALVLETRQQREVRQIDAIVYVELSVAAGFEQLFGGDPSSIWPP